MIKTAMLIINKLSINYTKHLLTLAICFLISSAYGKIEFEEVHITPVYDPTISVDELKNELHELIYYALDDSGNSNLVLDMERMVFPKYEGFIQETTEVFKNSKPKVRNNYLIEKPRVGDTVNIELDGFFSSGYINKGVSVVLKEYAKNKNNRVFGRLITSPKAYNAALEEFYNELGNESRKFLLHPTFKAEPLLVIMGDGSNIDRNVQRAVDLLYTLYKGSNGGGTGEENNMKQGPIIQANTVLDTLEMELRKLQKLHEDGLITEQELEKLREKSIERAYNN